MRANHGLFYNQLKSSIICKVKGEERGNVFYELSELYVLGTERHLTLYFKEIHHFFSVFECLKEISQFSLWVVWV